jgi:hypothetical protein
MSAPATSTSTADDIVKQYAGFVDKKDETCVRLDFAFPDDNGRWEVFSEYSDGYISIDVKKWWENTRCDLYKSPTSIRACATIEINTLYEYGFGSYGRWSDMSLSLRSLLAMAKLLRLVDTSPELFEFLMSLLKKTTVPEKTEYEFQTLHIINLVGILKFANQIMEKCPSEDWSRNSLRVSNFKTFEKFEQLFESRHVSEFKSIHQFSVISMFGNKNVNECKPRLNSRFIWVAAFCNQMFNQSVEFKALEGRLQQFAEYCWAEITRAKDSTDEWKLICLSTQKPDVVDRDYAIAKSKVENTLIAKATFDFLDNAESRVCAWLAALE